MEKKGDMGISENTLFSAYNYEITEIVKLYKKSC